MEDMYTKSSNNPADNGDNHNACRPKMSAHITLRYYSSDLPTATDMPPLGDTADKIWPPTTQSIKAYPII
jgi:hypothetical protein